jgi:uncharacterized protein
VHALLALLQCEKYHSAESARFKQLAIVARYEWKKWRKGYNDSPFRHPSRLTMKLHSDNNQQYQTVTGYDANGVEINAERFSYSLIVMPETPPRAWEVARFEDLQAAHFEQIAADAPDVVILGTGERQRFVHPRLITALSSRHVGVESMDSQAACRTYNVLMGEGRKVTLALIIDTTPA